MKIFRVHSIAPFLRMFRGTKSILKLKTGRRTFLHVLVLLKQVSGCVDVVCQTDGGKVFLGAFHFTRKLQPQYTILVTLRYIRQGVSRLCST